MRYDPLEIIANNSFLKYHSEHMDYICLHRSEFVNYKLYIITDCKDQFLVNPHNHRYNSFTTVLAGRIANVIFQRSLEGDHWFEYAFNTPLNGGAGFEFKDTAYLKQKSFTPYNVNESFSLIAEEVHTLVPLTDLVVLFQIQMEDTYNQPTKTFVKHNRALSLEGLYQKPTIPQVQMLLHEYWEGNEYDARLRNKVGI